MSHDELKSLIHKSHKYRCGRVVVVCKRGGGQGRGDAYPIRRARLEPVVPAQAEPILFPCNHHQPHSEMAIAPIVGKLRKHAILDISFGIGLGISAGYAYWLVSLFISAYFIFYAHNITPGMATTFLRVRDSREP